ncbi:MAG: hypothetical protein NTU88_16300, partial [Armatimonadetes bacterium]|nr:hypothetical protein [Armatimonadota bacterium]
NCQRQQSGEAMDYTKIIIAVVSLIVVVLVQYFIVQPMIMGIRRKKKPLEAVRYLRKMGFFSEYASLPDEELVSRLEQMYQENYEGPLDDSEGLLDVDLLTFDKTRVWYQDIECDVDMGQDVYVWALERLAAISRGAFQPKNIKESWESEEGPIEVSFTLNGEKQVVHPGFNYDYLDSGILDDINRMIKDSGYFFFIYPPFAQSAFITVLTMKELRKLITERRWEWKTIAGRLAGALYFTLPRGIGQLRPGETLGWGTFVISAQ